MTNFQKWWLGLLTIVVSILLIAVISAFLNDISYRDNTASVLISALGVMVTALVGWQVYNAIEMRGIIRDYDELKHRLEHYNQVQIDRILRIDNLNEARRLFNKSKTNKHGLLSDRYKDATNSAKLFLEAGCNSKDNEFLRSISQMEFILEMAEVVSRNTIGDFKSIKGELDEAYKAIIQKLTSEKAVVEQLITDINECHRKRHSLTTA